MRNTIENLILVIISLVVGVVIGHTITTKTTSLVLNIQKETIELAIKKETTSINNKVSTNVRKLKARKSQIELVTKPILKSKIEQTDTIIRDSIKFKKVTWLKRLFSRKARLEYRRNK